MRPPRRGYAVGAVVALSVWLAALFGARSLNAVVVPCLVGLAGGAVQLYRAPPPALDRSQPDSGFPGETRTVELAVESAVPCRVTEQVGRGLTVADPVIETAGDATHGYEVGLERRGERTIGPAAVVTTDALGLFYRRFTNPQETPVLVYPTLYALSGPVGVDQEESTIERGAFDRIRDYQPGDPLRDVHWKSSARRPADELVVAEYAGEDAGGVEIVAATRHRSEDAVDDLAAAAASIATALLDAGIPVGLEVGDGRIEPGVGERHRRDLLTLLARTGGGVVSGDRDPDVRILGTAGGVRVTTRGRNRPFDDLVAGVAA